MKDSEERGVQRARSCELGAVFALVTLVALAQIVLSTSTTFSRWKGGGFGMYSEPHPYSARSLWVQLRDANGATYLRLSSTDSRLADVLSGLSKDRRAVWTRRVDDLAPILMWPHDEALSEAGAKVGALIRQDSTALVALSGIEWRQASIAAVSVVETRLDLESNTFDNRVIATVPLSREDGTK